MGILRNFAGMKKLIIDAGSSKVDWCVMERSGATEQFECQGVNALTLTAEELTHIFSAAAAGRCSGVGEVHYFGAGCLDPGVCAKVASALRAALSLPPAVTVEVATDLLGAARALCGHKPGIACILGTGSNCCYFDGERIARHVKPLGYILGDEGSGAAMGKRLLNALYKRADLDALRVEFEAWLGMDYSAIIRKVYSGEHASRFLASLVPFIAEHHELDWLVREEFCSFLKNNVNFEEARRGVPLNFVGGVAVAFIDRLFEATELLGLEMCRVESRPMHGLIEYYL